MFGKKTTAEELLKLYSALSDEEKQKFLGTVNDKGEIGSASAEISETKDKEQEAPPVKGTEESVKEEPATPPVEDAPTVKTPATDAPAVLDTQTADNTAAILEGFGTRLTKIEEALKGFTELKELMEKFTQAQADKFGYNGTVPGGKTEFKDMSAAEMKNKILNGEI